jgi:hypothetical protein
MRSFMLIRTASPWRSAIGNQSRANLNLGSECSMNRTLPGDLNEFLSLVFGQLAEEGNLHVDPIDHSDLGIARGTILGMDFRV